jgi:hypothetical protein
MSGRGDNVVRLGCAAQAAIAEELRRHWQYVVDEGVPEHLRGLVLRFARRLAYDDAEAGAPLADIGAAKGVILLADFRRGDCKDP